MTKSILEIAKELLDLDPAVDAEVLLYDVQPICKALIEAHEKLEKAPIVFIDEDGDVWSVHTPGPKRSARLVDIREIKK
jgi:hypothetical protein